MVTASAFADRAQGKPVLYELWWRPLPAARDTSKNSAVSNPTESNQLDDPRTYQAWGEPVLLADNLTKCRWKLFSSGEQRTEHNAVWERELPAYVEFEIQTKTGLYENWMFEVGWSKGPELATRESTAGDGAGGAGAGGPNGRGQGGPRGPGGPGGPGGVNGPGGPHNPYPNNNNSGPGPHYDTMPTNNPK